MNNPEARQIAEQIVTFKDELNRVSNEAGFGATQDRPYEKLARAYLALEARCAEKDEALEAFLEMYLRGANSGDWGNWNPEEEPEVIAARAALDNGGRTDE